MTQSEVSIKNRKKKLFKVFNEEIYPLLTPSAIDPAHPFPFIVNQGRALVMRLNKKNKKRVLNAIIVIPKALSRFIEIDGNIMTHILSSHHPTLSQTTASDSCN